MTVERIGKYEVRRLLGEGATCEVLLAWDPFSRCEVAIKRLYPDLLTNRERGRLHRRLLENEAALAGKLDHPHIARILDAAIDDEQAYIVMEYARGGTLARFCRRDALLPFERLLEIVFKCTRALDYAQRRGITHRDIKPANILLATADGRDIKLSDFGAALHAAADATQVSGVGSPAYMSPQQIREMPLDHRSDIYSLGVVMYQLLTGALPFEAENNYSLLWRIAHEEPLPPSRLRPEVPDALDAIVGRAMEKEVERRYQTWTEFSHDLALAFRNSDLARDHGHVPDTEKFEALRGLALFRSFSDVELWEVIGLTHWSRAQAGTVLMREGESGRHVCFLVAGEAEITKRGRLLHLLTAGDCFGEMALFAAGGGVRSASVTAATEVTVLRLDAEALQRASNTCRMHFYEAFLEVLATRLSLADARLANT